MCGRYAIVTKVTVIEERFGAKASPQLKPTANVGVGMQAPVIASSDPHTIVPATFGLTPFWAKKAMYLFNARSEGDHNQSDDPQYRGAKGIIEKPAFRKPIRSQRCLVIADAFMEGPKDKGLDTPYLFFRTDGDRPFAFAGIYDVWQHPTTGERTCGFAIVTAPANRLVAGIGHHRCPVMLEKDEEKAWLDLSTPLADVTAMLRPPSESSMNGYPIDPAIRQIKNQQFHLLLPVGQRLRPEYKLDIEKDIELFGMGESRSGRGREGRQGELFSDV